MVTYLESEVEQFKLRRLSCLNFDRFGIHCVDLRGDPQLAWIRLCALCEISCSWPKVHVIKKTSERTSHGLLENQVLVDLTHSLWSTLICVVMLAFRNIAKSTFHYITSIKILEKEPNLPSSQNLWDSRKTFCFPHKTDRLRFSTIYKKNTKVSF